MREFKLDESEDGMVLSGTLTIENASSIRELLLAALARGRQIQITVGEDAVIDISFLQIICSMHRSAIRTGKTVTLGRLSEAFESIIVNAGFARSRGCKAGQENNCLWTLGGNND